MLLGDSDRSMSEKLRHALQRYTLSKQADGESIAEAVRVSVRHVHFLAESAECAAVVSNGGIDVAFACPEIVLALMWRETLERFGHERWEWHIDARTGLHAAKE